MAALWHVGVVTTADLGRVMRAIGLEPSDDELANMITEVDGSGKGAVDFKEFMTMMSKNGTSTAAEIKETFALFNSSGEPFQRATSFFIFMLAHCRCVYRVST